MSDQKPTGVFVRLPLSEAQLKNVDRLAQEISENNSENEWRFHRHYVAACEELIAAIGTPITGGELEVVGVRARDIRSIATSAWPYSGNVENDTSTYEAQFLVSQSDALAKLAEKDAEIARYRVALSEAKTFHEEQDESISKQPPSSQGSWRRNLHKEQIENIEAALKGPEA